MACAGSGRGRSSRLPRKAGTRPPPASPRHSDPATSGSGSTTEPRTSARTTRSAAGWREAKICGRGSGSGQARRSAPRADRERSATWRAWSWATRSASSSSAPARTARTSSARARPRSADGAAAVLVDAEELTEEEERPDEHGVDEPDRADRDRRPHKPVRRAFRVRILAELQVGDDERDSVDDRDDDRKRRVRDDLAVAAREQSRSVRHDAEEERDPELERGQTRDDRRGGRRRVGLQNGTFHGSKCTERGGAGRVVRVAEWIAGRRPRDGPHGGLVFRAS